MITIGIDIGLDGAIAAIDQAGKVDIRDVPTKTEGTTRRIDGRKLLYVLRDLVPATESALIAFEDVRARPAGNGGGHGNSMHSQASMIGSRRAIEAVIDISGLRSIVVQPQRWKKHFGLIKPKDAPKGFDVKQPSVDKATDLFPFAAGRFLVLKKHHNRAEALLIARWAQETQT